MSDSAPKLKKGMRVFAKRGQGPCFDLHWALLSSPIYPQHAKAFKDAADMILDSYGSTNTQHNDPLLFPVLYLYRHYLELQLKDILYLGIKCGHYTAAQIATMTENRKGQQKGILIRHDLIKLWTAAKRLLQKHYPKDNQIALVEPTIQDFHKIDFDGQTVRYDRDTTLKRRAYMNILPAAIEIVTLRTTMGAIYDYLDTSYAGILDWWDPAS
jgi:hypothetical protein